MKLLTPSKNGKTIKDKKNSIINRNSQSYSTPVRATSEYQDRTIILNPSEKQKQYRNTTSQYIETSPKQDSPKQYITRTEPKNAFNKKCFQRKRTIMPIQNLIQLQNTQSKIKVPFRSQEQSLDQSQRSNRSYSKFLDKRKTVVDRKPFNQLAHFTSISERKRTRTDENRSLSHSKRIKYSIIKQDKDC